MEIYVRFSADTVSCYTGTKLDIERGFANGFFRFERDGVVDYIPVSAVQSLSTVSSEPGARGFREPRMGDKP